MKCQSLGPENHTICSSTYCSDITKGSVCRFASRTWTPILTGVWGHCQVGLIHRRAESCPQISQPENSRDSSIQVPLFPKGHLAMSGDHSYLEFTEECGRCTASREQRPEMLLTRTEDRPRGQLLPSPQMPTTLKMGDCTSHVSVRSHVDQSKSERRAQWLFKVRQCQLWVEATRQCGQNAEAELASHQ